MLPWKVGHRGLDYVQPKPASARDIDHALCLLSWLFSSDSFIASLHVRYWNYLRKCKEMISSSYCATAALKTLRLHEEWLIQAVVPTLILLTAFFRVSAARSSTQQFCSTTLLPFKKKTLALKEWPSWIMTAAAASLFCSALSMSTVPTDLYINRCCV